MTDNVIEIKTEDPKSVLIGPFESYRVVVDGYRLPLLTGYKKGDEIWITCDNRFTFGPFTEDTVYQACLMAGQCMAISKGFCSLHVQEPAPFAPKVINFEENRNGKNL